MRIRSDLEGVVYVPVGGDVVCLAAGDVVPDGVVVGGHLTSGPEEPVKAPEETEATEPEEPVEAPEETETKGAGNSRGRRSSTRA